ncbi:unnamed protein product, partial [Trichobilharzia regenti]
LATNLLYVISIYIYVCESNVSLGHLVSFSPFTEIKPTKPKDDLRIKLESELYQKVRQAVKTPPRERMIRRRLNEFEQQIRKRLENEKEKKQLVTQLNDVVTLGGGLMTNPNEIIANSSSSSKSSDIKLNSIDETGYMDVRMHPESYQQNIGWYKRFDMNEVNGDNGNISNNNFQRILWNKKNLLTEKGLKKIRFILFNHDTGGENQNSLNSNDVLKRQLNKTIGFRVSLFSEIVSCNCGFFLWPLTFVAHNS